MGLFPKTRMGLAPSFILPAAVSEAGFSEGRLVCVNWDVRELRARGLGPGSVLAHSRGTL